MWKPATAFLFAGFSAWALLAGNAWSRAAEPVPVPTPVNRIPYVPTRHDAVRDLLWLADAGTNDVVYDLGSGDGRVVISAVRDFGVRKAVGVEIDPELVRQSRVNGDQAGVANRVQFIQGDLFTNVFSEASIVVLYLGHGANLDLRAPFLRMLKPGARVVSHQFGMGEWKPDKLLDVRTPLLGMYGEMFNEFRINPDVPDYDNLGSRANHDVLTAWVVPAPVAGAWRGRLPLQPEGGELTIILHQRLGEVTGSFQLQGSTNLNGGMQVDLWGDHCRCWCIPANGSGHRFQMWFDGQVRNDQIDGTLWVSQGAETREVKWSGRRDKIDFTGTWQWTGPSNSPVQLQIQRREGKLAAFYTDKHRAQRGYQRDSQPDPIPVTDFYDFGGGFYFTLLLGLEGTSISRGSRRTGPEDGWLIGEATARGDALDGNIAFYPYRATTMNTPPLVHLSPPGNQPGSQTGRQTWRPAKVSP